MTDEQLVRCAEIIDACIFKLRSFGLTSDEIKAFLVNAAKAHGESA